MSAIVLAVLVVACALLICDGGTDKWGKLHDAELATDGFAVHNKWHGPSDGADHRNYSLMTKSYLLQSSCKLLGIRDNCFSHNPQRAQALLKRISAAHITSPTRSVILNSTDILLSLQHQTIMFIGDSTISAVYATLVCHFSGMVSEVTHKSKWLYDKNTILRYDYQQDLCPEHPSCYLIAAKSHIPSYNTTLVYQQLHLYSGDARAAVVRQVESIKPSVVIVNFGMHYKVERELTSDLIAFKRSLLSLFERQRNAHTRLAQWLWLETFPQHFPTKNGYFATPYESKMPTGTLWCAKIADMRHHHKNDWRNRLPEKHLADFARSGRVIAIAEALYSQWDAHVDHGDSLQARPFLPDCSHYCVGSGVFRFVLGKVLTAVAACVRGACKDTHFFDGSHARSSSVA